MSERGEGDGRWLVVVDMQHVFGDADSPWFTPTFGEVVPQVNRLADHFGERVVYTRFVAPEQPWGSWTEYYRQWEFALRPHDDRIWQIVPDVHRPGLPVIDEPTMGKWGERLRAATGGAERLVLCGVSTDCCVLSTALAASDGGAWVQVVTDACGGISPTDHQRALDAMALYGPQITLTTVDGVVSG